MNQVDNTMRSAGMATLRVLLGLIFFWQGFAKVFKWGMDQLWEQSFSNFSTTFIPDWLSTTTMYYTSYAELLCGVALVLGLFRKNAYLILASVLLLVAFGHGVESGIWSLNHVIFRAALLIPLMLLPMQWDRWALDRRFNF